jgi:hypothetical protein
MSASSQQQRSRNTHVCKLPFTASRVCSLIQFCCYSLHKCIKRKCLYFVHKTVVAYMVQQTCTCAEGSKPAWGNYIFQRSTTLSRLDRKPIYCIEPAVGPWFIWVFWAGVRVRSSVLKKPAEASVPIFFVWTAGPVRFLKLCYCHHYKTIATDKLRRASLFADAAELTTHLLRLINILWLSLCRINKFELYFPKTVAIPYTCESSGYNLVYLLWHHQRFMHGFRR